MSLNIEKGGVFAQKSSQFLEKALIFSEVAKFF